MITYFVTAAHSYTMGNFLDSWGAELRPMIQIRNYSDLASAQWLPGGTYIFSDLERLTPALALIMGEVWTQLQAGGSNVRLFNHPEKAMRRIEFLKTMRATGRNGFRAYQLGEDSTNMRFPVFIRGANDHEGSRTDLLKTREAVDANIHAALCFGHDPRELLIVEYCNTADADGVHHKYSAFRVGDRIVPRHLVFSRRWMLKYPDLLQADKIAREKEYIETNPHETVVREAFDLARIDYGRCDYSVVDGRLQIWEINTNPLVMMQPHEYQPSHVPAQEYFAKQIKASYKAINLEADPELKIPIRFERRMMDKILSLPLG